MTHTEESLMALADRFAVAHALVIRFGSERTAEAMKDREALRLAIREVLSECKRLDEGWSEANSRCLAENFKTIEQRDRAEQAEAECERLRNLLREARQCVHKEANDEREMEGRGYYCDLAERIAAAIAQEAKP